MGLEQSTLGKLLLSFGSIAFVYYSVWLLSANEVLTLAQPFIAEDSLVTRLFPPKHLATVVPLYVGTIILCVTIFNVGWSLVWAHPWIQARKQQSERLELQPPRGWSLIQRRASCEFSRSEQSSMFDSRCQTCSAPPVASEGEWGNRCPIQPISFAALCDASQQEANILEQLEEVAALQAVQPEGVHIVRLAARHCIPAAIARRVVHGELALADVLEHAAGIGRDANSSSNMAHAQPSTELGDVSGGDSRSTTAESAISSGISVAAALTEHIAEACAAVVSFQLVVAPEFGAAPPLPVCVDLSGTTLATHAVANMSAAAGVSHPDAVVATQTIAVAPLGRESVFAASLRHLPPFLLTVHAHAAYPSHAPPLLQLECDWMTPCELERVAAKVAVTITESLDGDGSGWSGVPCGHILAELLRDEAIEAVFGEATATAEAGGRRRELLLAPDAPRGGASVLLIPVVKGPGAAELCVQTLTDSESAVPLEQTLESLIAADTAGAAAADASAFHLCPICLDQHLGSAGMRLACGHWTCSECLQTLAVGAVNDGTLGALRCVHPECRAPLPPHTLRALLPAAAFDRWEALSLARALAVMRDAVECPRCGDVTIESDGLGQCSRCCFAFCAKCLQAWHIGSCPAGAAVLQDRVRQVARRRPYAQGAVADELAREEAALRGELESIVAVARSSKPCPHCGAAIEKTGGCNKVTCSLCSGAFCFACGEAISGYTHFSGPGRCILMDAGELIEWERRWDAMVAEEVGDGGGGGLLEVFGNDEDGEVNLPPPPPPPPQAAARPPGWRRRRRRQRAALPTVAGHTCPRCGRRNSRGSAARGGVARCYSCMAEFCFTCGTLLRGRDAMAEHFAARGACRLRA